jgi:hypothetical protein
MFLTNCRGLERRTLVEAGQSLKVKRTAGFLRFMLQSSQSASGQHWPPP